MLLEGADGAKGHIIAAPSVRRELPATQRRSRSSDPAQPKLERDRSRHDTPKRKAKVASSCSRHSSRRHFNLRNPPTPGTSDPIAAISTASLCLCCNALNERFMLWFSDAGAGRYSPRCEGRRYHRRSTGTSTPSPITSPPSLLSFSPPIYLVKTILAPSSRKRSSSQEHGAWQTKRLVNWIGSFRNRGKRSTQQTS